MVKKLTKEEQVYEELRKTLNEGGFPAPRAPSVMRMLKFFFPTLEDAEVGKCLEAGDFGGKKKTAAEIAEESGKEEGRVKEILDRLRQALREWELRIRDVGFLPEGEIHSRSEGATPYEMGHNSRQYPVEKIVNAAELASSLKPGVTGELVKALGDEDSAVRYWGAMGILMRGAGAVSEAGDALHKALSDASPSVRIIAAQALGQYGSGSDLNKALPVLLELAPLDKNGLYTSMLAMNALDALDGKAKRAAGVIKALPAQDPSVHQRARSYVASLIKKTVADLE